MKPKTKLQIRVAGLSAQLPPIKDEHFQWSYDKYLEPFSVISRKTISCLNCGHSEKSVLQEWQEKVVGHTCSNCGFESKVHKHTSTWYDEGVYTAVITTIEGFQVVRILLSKLYMKRNQPCSYAGTEVMQYWIDEKGRFEVMAKSVSQAFIIDSWIWQSDLEIRRYHSHQRYNINPLGIYPKKKILPIMRRNGFNGHFYGIAPHQLFRAILTDSKSETLIKAKQMELFKWQAKSIDSDFLQIHNGKYWPIVCICIRNNYIVKSADFWLDYIKLLEWFGKDIRNPKYCCPTDLKAAHDRYERKKREAIRKRKEEDRRKEIAESNIIYKEQKQHFFGLTFSDKTITVKVLESVQEFMEEGDELKHCVFTNEYYEREESLVLSARINGEPIETVEVSLLNMEVVQSRGYDNNPTKHHNRIVELVTKNMHEIQRRHQLSIHHQKTA